MSLRSVFASVANNFVHPQTANYYGYHAFGELARFIYCLHQKIKKGCSLPLVDQWDEYMPANQSRFAAINNEVFLSGTRVLVALNKVGSYYLKKEFRREARQFLEEFTNSVLSTVDASSNIGLRLSCFCPVVLFGGDNLAPLRLFKFLQTDCWRKGG